MLAKLAGLVTRRSKRILIIAGLFFVVAAVVGGPVAGRLSAEDEDFQDPSAQNIVASKQLHAAAGDRQDSGLVALFSPGRDIRTDPSARAKLREIENTIEADPGVVGARSYLDTRNPAFISRDGRQTVVIAAFTGDELSAAHRLRAKLAPDAVKIGGPDVVSPEIGDEVSSDLARAELIAFPLLFLL